LWLYWLVAAFSMKKGRIPSSRELRIRAIVRTVCGAGRIAWGGLRRDRLPATSTTGSGSRSARCCPNCADYDDAFDGLEFPESSA
jgi:hypothetical protein